MIPAPLNKHRLDGIGAASARAVLAVLASNPSLAFLSIGPIGQVVFYLLKTGFSMLASGGLVMLNVGAEKLQTAVDKVDYDTSWETAERLINEIRKTGRELTPEEIKAIDDKVIAQFRKFGKLGRKK